MGNEVPSNLTSKQSTITEINNNQLLTFHPTILTRQPTLKASFSYIRPLKYQIQQLPEQPEIPQILTKKSLYQTETNIQSSIIMGQETLFGSETFHNLSFVQQIKVKWNSFIKMKEKNYEEDYNVIKKIGKGGFGTVNKVKNIYTQVIRAAKIILKKQLKQTQHQKLLIELTIMKQLDHPNIIKLYEVYDYEEQYVLILQLSEGGQLYQRIKTKKLPQSTIRHIMGQIIKTLIYLHSQKIVHRDLKPQNMLFQQKGSDTLKLIDFGLAARLPSSQDPFLHDRVGTPSYIAPEIIYKKYNEKCDIWAAGVIFYFMVTGIMPFRGQNQAQLMQSILRQEPSFSNVGWKKFSPQCQQLIKLMLQKKPQMRPSASQVYQHAWFYLQKKNSLTPSILDEKKGIQILRNIRKFSFKNKLQALINTFIASQLLTYQQKKLLNQLFEQIDTDHNGVISTEQLHQALSRKKDITIQRVQHLKRIMDTNGSGQIQYTEFLVASLHHEDFMKKEYFQKAFAYFDIDHSGKITYEEVVQFLGDTGSQEKEEDIIKMFKDIDADGNGQIDLEQFIRLFISDTAQLMKFFPPIDLTQQTLSQFQVHPDLNQDNILQLQESEQDRSFIGDLKSSSKSKKGYMDFEDTDQDGLKLSCMIKSKNKKIRNSSRYSINSSQATNNYQISEVAEKSLTASDRSQTLIKNSTNVAPMNTSSVNRINKQNNINVFQNSTVKKDVQESNTVMNEMNIKKTTNKKNSMEIQKQSKRNSIQSPMGRKNGNGIILDFSQPSNIKKSTFKK